MAAKFICLVACISAASALPIGVQYVSNSGYNGDYSNGGYSNGGSILIANAGEKYYDQPAQYDFAYGVKDVKTGDIKEQQESRKGDVVQGRYSLVDSDGYERIVEYSADDKNGFNAVVQRKPTQYQVPVVQKVVAAPLLTKYATVAAPAVYYQGASNGGYYNGEQGSSYSSQSFGNGGKYNQY